MAGFVEQNTIHYGQSRVLVPELGNGSFAVGDVPGLRATREPIELHRVGTACGTKFRFGH